jgi:hypothetical protein
VAIAPLRECNPFRWIDIAALHLRVRRLGERPRGKWPEGRVGRIAFRQVMSIPLLIDSDEPIEHEKVR